MICHVFLTGILFLISTITPAAAFNLGVDDKTGDVQAPTVVEVHRHRDRHTSYRRKAQNVSPDNSISRRVSTLDYEGYWFAKVTVGGQDVDVVLDTGSADLWLFSPDSTSAQTGGYPTWDPHSATKTSLMKGYNFSVNYGTGDNQVSGPVYQTNVCVGSDCTVMAVGSATDVNNVRDDRSGILGLAFSGGNSVRPKVQPTFMESISPKLKQPIFATSFASDNSSSRIAFGGNPFEYLPPLQGIVVDKSSSAPYPYSWSYTNISYSTSGQQLGNFDVVFDTGGPLMSASESIVRGYYKHVPGAKDVKGDATQWTVPCGTNLPDLQLDFDNGAWLVIPGFRFYNGISATTGSCTVWLVKENTATRAVIGDPFFVENVVVFNQDTGGVQWAPKTGIVTSRLISELDHLAQKIAGDKRK